jgi:two-component system sensor histidine kinase VanS
MQQLLTESDQEIELSPEMEPIAKEMNKIKSALRKKEQDAQNAEQRKNDLVVYLAHDIKTPLTSVIGYLSLLDEAPDMPAEQKAKYVNITLEKAFRLEQLINEFFEITRYNLQTILLEKQEINLSYMLLQMADEFYPQLSASGKAAVVNAPDELLIYADPDKLARVFNNIMKNAIAYGYNDSVIKIDAALQEADVLITISNQGNTIPAHKLETIFDKFFRLDDARSSSTGGAGLGLAIAKSIVTAHGGTIQAESKEEQTVFTVILPVHAD